jgi:cysteine desulfurase / selenocysteine lyase
MNSTDINQLIGDAGAFPILERLDFYNHAGVAPLAKVAADAMRRFAGQAETVAYVGTGWYRDLEQLRSLAAKMINAHADEVALLKNTSEGIATVANGLDWRPGDRIITTGVEYPANIYPWMDVSKRFGAELVMVPEQTLPGGQRHVPLDAILREAAHPRARLVTLSHVEFASGQRLDLAAVGRFCREHGRLLCVDAIQSMGVLPLDVQAMNIDFLSADGHKWMLGPEGAAIFYCRREHLQNIRPLITGWMNVINADAYGTYDFTLKPTAARFECGSHNVPGFLALKASLELLDSIGIPALSLRLKTLTDRLIDGLAAKGYTIASPREDEQWSGIVSFTSPSGDHQQIFSTLRTRHRTEIALREGRLRCSPHFYNTEAQIDRLVANLP